MHGHNEGTINSESCGQNIGILKSPRCHDHNEGTQAYTVSPLYLELQVYSKLLISQSDFQFPDSLL